jgi:hypothetical protein
MDAQPITRRRTKGRTLAMEHIAKPDEQLWLYSMGKRFRVRAIFTDVSGSNRFMEQHNETALIACFGPFQVIANVYEGVKESDRMVAGND